MDNLGTEGSVQVLELPVRLDADGNPAQYDPGELAFMSMGSCRYYDPNIWSTDTNHGKTSMRGTVVINGVRMRKSSQVELARRICLACPVLADCAAFIKRYPEGEGVWAGTIPEERA